MAVARVVIRKAVTIVWQVVTLGVRFLKSDLARLDTPKAVIIVSKHVDIDSFFDVIVHKLSKRWYKYYETILKPICDI